MLAAMLRDGRNAKTWTLREAAAHTGVSNGYLSLMEKGEVKAPSPRYLLSLATHYGLSFDRLMALAGHPSGTVPAQGNGASLGAREASSARRRAIVEEIGKATEDAHASEDAKPRGTEQRSPRLGGPRPARGGTDADADWEKLVLLVAEDLAGLSPDDIARVRAFIAGMAAARR